MEKKRVFFGLEAKASWPNNPPKGRLIQESFRHMTLAFLGEIDYDPLKKHLGEIPLPKDCLGKVGKCKKILFLPEKHPRVVAFDFKEFAFGRQTIQSYCENLQGWLISLGYVFSKTQQFLPHISVAKAPFVIQEWKQSFHSFPILLTHLHLYESLDRLCYKILWTHKQILPFEEVEHIADLAYLIRGKNLQEIYLHAQLALAFSYPAFFSSLDFSSRISLDEVIICLNNLISHFDSVYGSPFKAVSFHGEIRNREAEILEWEMIIDV